MGTNYTWRSNVCECCKRSDTYHIGKKSGGWEFSFHGYRDPEFTVISWDTWKALLSQPGTEIVDEYDEVCAFDEFVKMVEDRTRENGEPLSNHFDYCAGHVTHRLYMDGQWKDDEGYSFSDTDFS